MRQHGVSFKQALNDVIRAGEDGQDRVPFRTATADLGTPTIELDRALRLAGELEDEELLRRARLGK
jgi:hypothetical protein